MFTRILVAVASDGIVDRVIEMAQSLAEGPDTRVALVHVVDVGLASLSAATPMSAGASMFAAADLLEVNQQSGQALLSRLAAQFPQGKVETMLYEGAPAATIITVAQEWQADLIIAGTHGRGGLERFFLGSVAQDILRHAPCPVLTLPYKTATA